jgi:hypothetical protein
MEREPVGNRWIRRQSPREVGLNDLGVVRGRGGQVLGLEQAGIDQLGLVELDETSCEALLFNRPSCGS